MLTGKRSTCLCCAAASRLKHEHKAQQDAAMAAHSSSHALRAVALQKGAELQRAIAELQEARLQVQLGGAWLGVLDRSAAVLMGSARMLHQCFRFTDPHCRELLALLPALNILAGADK